MPSHINLDDFNLNKLLLGESLDLETKQFKNLESELILVGKQQTKLCLIAAGGTGVECCISRFKQENPEKIYVLPCRRNQMPTVLGNLMMQLEFGHRLVNWYDTPIDDILEALLYYLKEINNRTILFFDNCDQLAFTEFSNLISELKPFDKYVGIVFRITPEYGKKVLNSSEISLRRFLAGNGRFVVDHPSEDDLVSACINNGIKNVSVAKALVENTTDFEVVTARFDQLYRDVKNHMDDEKRKK